MANPTTAFGWVMPNSADLVTDLPADFAVFGQGVDTSMQYLLGGTTGQVLSKTSATNMAFTWIANDQGDLTAITAGTGISVTSPTGPIPTVAIDATVATLTGSQTLTNKTLTAPIISSISNTGTLTLPTSTDTLVGKATTDTLTNKTLTSPALTTPTISTATTNGDLLYGTGSGALQRLGIGSSAQVLAVSGGIPAWSTPAASGMSFITRASFSSVATTTTSFDGVFTATYKNYLIIIESMFAATGGDDLLFQFKYSTSTIDSTANYNGAAAFISRSVGGVALTQTSSGTSMALSNTSGDSSQKNAYALNVERVGNSSEQPAIHGTGASGGGDYGGLWIGGGLFASQTYTGFLLKSSSSNITGIVTVYGLAAA